MPILRPRIPIPKLTAQEVRVANNCAVLIWNGISYIDGKKTTSDRDLLVYFSNEFQNIITNPNQQVLLSHNIIHDLIIVSLLKPMYRKQNELSFPQLFSFLQNQYPLYNQAYNQSPHAAEKLQISTDFVIAAGKAVVLPGVSVKAGYRVPFLSRLLFFATPHMLVFNYANRLAEKQLNYQSRPHDAYPHYGKDMLSALRNNWTELSKYNIPTEELGQPEQDISLAYNTHWWTRRVLDLALLIKFNVFQPSPVALSGTANLRYSYQTSTLANCP
jgi:hypothetical protein